MNKKQVNTPYQDAWNQFTWQMDVSIVTPWLLGQSIDTSVIEKMFGRYGDWEEMKQKVDEHLENEDYWEDKCDELEKQVQEEIGLREQAEWDLRDIEKYLTDVIEELGQIEIGSVDERMPEEYEKLLQKLTDIAEEGVVTSKKRK